MNNSTNPVGKTFSEIKRYRISYPRFHTASVKKVNLIKFRAFSYLAGRGRKVDKSLDDFFKTTTATYSPWR